MGTCLAVLSLAVILLAPPVMTDPDALTNLAVGRHISASGAVPAVDPFTFGAGEARWSNPEWLASLLMYQVHRLGGEAGLQRFKRALLAGAWCLLFGLAVARGAPPWLTLGLLLLLLPGTAWRFTLRNHLHLFVLVPLYGLVIHGALSRARPRLLLLLLPLALLWANLHASFVVGWFLLAAALVGALKQGRRDPVIRGLALILLVHPLLALISPHGIYNYGQLLDHLAQVSLLRQHIQEWRGPAETLTQTARTPLLLLMVVGAASFTPAYNRKDLHGLILLLGGLAAALVSQRFIPLLVFLAAPVVASSLHGVLARVAPLMARLAVGALLLVGALGVLRVARDAAADPPTAALGRQGSAAGAAGFLGRHAPAGTNLFNDYNSGPYFLWLAAERGVRVYIDPRNNLGGQRLARYLDWLLPSPAQFEREVRAAGVTLAHVDADQERMRPLAVHLGRSPAWALVYFDGRHALFARRAPPNMELIRRQGLLGFRTRALPAE